MHDAPFEEWWILKLVKCDQVSTMYTEIIESVKSFIKLQCKKKSIYNARPFASVPAICINQGGKYI